MSLRVYGDRLLKIPKEARPTPSKVRSALFNIWQHKIAGARWLDLCTGSGAMSAEALLRGAIEVVGIEISATACKIIQDNWQKVCQPEQKFQVLRGDVVKNLSKLSGKFDLVYFDPPYASNLYLPVLSQLYLLLDPSSTIAVEHSNHHVNFEQISTLVPIDRRVYGQTVLTFFKLADYAQPSVNHQDLQTN